MFNFFKSKKQSSSQDLNSSLRAKRGNLPETKQESLTLHLTGLHCTSCAVNIDLALEDLPGVKSTTSYAKSETKIDYDPSQTTLDSIHSTIRDLGYSIE